MHDMGSRVSVRTELLSFLRHEGVGGKLEEKKRRRMKRKEGKERWKN